MDIGLHIPESNENSSLSQRELRSTEYCKTMSFHQNMRSASEQMLSFSSSSDKHEAFDFTKFVGLDNTNNNNKTSFSPFLHQIPSSYCKNSGGGGGYGYGYGYGGLMNTSLTGVKGPFTLTQWAELEQQALIYKYITANVPVPSSLLLSIKKAFYPYGSLPPNSFGWGGFHLGFSGGNMDPEPGRCRRTDGKKWRCSRDAVPDQKYCERHINRGRHRSRKPVEGHSGHTLSNKVIKPPIAAIAAAQQQHNLLADSITNRVGNSRGRSIVPTTINTQRQQQQQQQSKESSPVLVPIHQKQRNIEFGHISSDSLLNPSHKTPSSLSLSSSSYLDFTNNTTQQDHLKSDWTQLSISTPHHHNNINNNNKLLLSPLRLSREFDDETTTTLEPTNWIPISWGNSNSNSLGGPLGEVLNSTTNSPTGVLQNSTFCSLSNSSSVSSPVCGGTENKNNGDDLLGSSAATGTTLLCSSSSVTVERNGNHFPFAT